MKKTKTNIEHTESVAPEKKMCFLQDGKYTVPGCVLVPPTVYASRGASYMQTALL